MNHLFGSAYTPVANLYLGLATADPGKVATGASMNEVTNSNNYAREAITFDAAASRAIIQAAAIEFNQASGSWGTITHWAILDSATYGEGNVLAYGAFTSGFAVVSGNTPNIADEQIQISFNASSGEGFTTQLVNWLLDLMFRNQAYAQPQTGIALAYVSGSDADTTISGEVLGTDYARVTVNKAGGAAPAWDAVSGGVTENSGEITFPTVGAGGWSQVTNIRIVDASGNVLAFDNDQIVDQTPGAGDTVKFADGALDISMT